jgi:hypothetical protein
MAFFIFNAVLIDFARLLVAQRHLENSVRAGARSMLAPYDSDLLNYYGLFGQKTSEPEMIFDNVLKESLSVETDADVYRYVDLKLENSSASNNPGNLGQHRFFERHILEEMKYKVLLRGWLGDLLGVVQGAGQSASSHDVIKTSNDTLKSYEQIIKEVENAIKQLDELGDLGEEYIDLRKLNEETAAEGADETAQGGKSNDEIEDKKNELLKKGSEILPTLSTIEGRYEEIDQYMQQLSEMMDHSSEPVAKPYEGLKPVVEELRDELNNLTDVIKKDEYIEKNISGQLNKVEAKRHRLDNELDHIKDSRNKVNKENERAREEGIQQYEAELNKQLEDDEDFMAFYESLDQFYTNYINVNQGLDIEDDNFEVEDNPQTLAEKATAFFSKIALGGMEQIYINEYVLNRFNYKMFEENESSEVLGTHKLSNQEVEYVIYGLGSQNANIGAAYAEIYAILIAVRVTENLTSKPIPDPIAIATLVATGIIEATADVLKLMNGNEVQLSKFAPNVKHYKDYLRLVLLSRLILPTFTEKRNSRMQALIQLNTDADLFDRATYVEGRAEASIRLWFIPSIFDAMTTTQLLNGQVEGNRYTFSRTIMFSY